MSYYYQHACFIHDLGQEKKKQIEEIWMKCVMWEKALLWDCGALKANPSVFNI